MAVGHTPHKRTINVFVLAMLSMAVVISLRNLPLTATFGLSSLFFYIAAALFFMIPYALVSAELASGWPKAGGVYVWVREAFGDKWGFFAIWMQWFHNMTWYPAMLAFVGAGIAYLFNPALATNRTYLICVILVGFWSITFLNFLGIKISSWVSTIFLIMGTIIPGAILIYFGVDWLIWGQTTQVVFEKSAFFPEFHHTNFVFLAGIFLALSGLEVSANLAREVKNPQRNYPRAIFMAVVLTLFILIFGSLSIAMVIPKGHISLVSGLMDAYSTFFATVGISPLLPIIVVFIVLGALGELNAWTIAGAKGLFVTTEHGLLPPFLHKLNSRGVPTRLLFFQALTVTVATFIFHYLPNVNTSYWVLSAISAQMYILMYILLFLAGLRLRYKRPEVLRSYRVPYKNVGIWIVSVVGLAASLFALGFSFMPPEIFETGKAWKYELIIGVGLLVSCGIPLLLFALRKPEWQREVLEEIREEIHQSTH